MAASAATGSYEVSACNYAPEAVNNSWFWATNDPSDPSHYAEHANCPDRLGGDGGSTDQEGGLSTTDALGLSSGAPPGTRAGWTFTAPTGTTIAAITYERYVGHDSDPDNYWSPALRADGTIIPGETCLDTVPNGESCHIGGPPEEGTEPSSITGLSAHQLSVGIECDAPAGEECITGATEHEAWAAMYGATVTLSDPTPPTLATPTGALWEPGETGYHKGTQTVTVAATDTGGGVQSIELTVDGHLIQTYTATCNYTIPQPCQNSTGPQALTLPTTALSDGTHTLTLTATDAAGNQSSTTAQITIDNSAPPPPTELTASAGQPGTSTFLATWRDPQSQVAPITGATYQLCPASGPGVCDLPASAPPRGPATISTPGPGTWTLAVWLTNAAGNSSAASAAYATLTVPPADSSGSPSGSPNSNGSRTTDDSPTQPTSLHITETIHQRKLIIRIHGSGTGWVRVTFTARLRGRLVAAGTKIVALAHGTLTASFRLMPRTAARAAIRVTARLAHGPLATSMLHR
jgi:hypothetical protein